MGHLVRFEFTSTVRQAVRAGAAVKLGCDHANYPAHMQIPPEAFAGLAGDLPGFGSVALRRAGGSAGGQALLVQFAPALGAVDQQRGPDQHKADTSAGAEGLVVDKNAQQELDRRP